MRKYVFACVLLLFVVFMAGCGTSTNTGGVPDPEKIVPERDALIKNLEKSGYTVTILSAVDGSDIPVDRVLAEKGEKFIDIVYGLSDEDAAVTFDLFTVLYPDGYFILAQNGNYVYAVSDRQTFAKAGFTTTDNVGEQYICN